MPKPEYDFSVKRVQRLIPSLNKPLFSILLPIGLNILGAKKINKLIYKPQTPTGLPFIQSVLSEIGTNVEIEGEEHLKNLPEGAFVVTGNHPFGAVDGLCMWKIILGLRPDFKIMLNNMLTFIRGLEAISFGVNPVNGKPNDKNTMSGMRGALEHLSNGSPIGIFPAGAVATLNKQGIPIDRPWQPSVVRMIQKAGVPVVPFYVHGNNSKFYYFLRSIDYRLSSARMPMEIFNKKQVKISIGEIIPAEKIAKYQDVKALAEFLRKKTFEAGGIILE